MTLKRYHFLWLSSILLMFLIVHATTPRIDGLLNGMTEWITGDGFIERNVRGRLFQHAETGEYKTKVLNEIVNPLKSIIFLLCLLVVAAPIFKETAGFIKEKRIVSLKAFKKIIILSLLSMIVLSVFILPNQGHYGYTEMTIDPYTSTDWEIRNKRFLMPFLAHVLQFKGEMFFYFLNQLLSFGLICLILVYFSINNVQIRFYQLVSLLTCSFMMHQFQLTNPQTLVFLMLLSCITFPLSDRSKLSLLVLALLTHEGSMIMSLVLSLFVFRNKRSIVIFYIVCAIYLLFWTGAHGFNLENAFNSHNVPETASGLSLTTLEWMAKFPERFFAGLFLSYKALWLIIFLALFIVYRTRQYTAALLITLLLSASLFMCLIGVDTSRLMGWSFIALLVSIKILSRSNNQTLIKSCQVIYAVNLFIPSIYVGLNEIYTPPGLYAYMYNMM